MAGLTARIDKILSLGWQKASEPPPRLWPGDRRLIAARWKERACIALGREPRGPAEMARALGMSVHRLPVPGCGGEGADGRRIFYRWHNDDAIRRTRVAHGLAHAILVLEDVPHSESDALLLTLDFR